MNQTSFRAQSTQNFRFYNQIQNNVLDTSKGSERGTRGERKICNPDDVNYISNKVRAYFR